MRYGDVQRQRIAHQNLDAHYRELARSTPGKDGDLYRALGDPWAEGTITDEAVGGTASAVLPKPLANMIVLFRDRFAKVRGLSFIVQMGPGRTQRVPSAGRAAAAIVAEGAAGAAQTPLLAEPILQKRKIGCHMQASDEVIEDSPFNLVSLFSQRAGEAIGYQEDVEATKTSSVLFSASIAGGTAGAVVGGYPDPTPAGATALAIGHVYSTYYSLPQQYRGNAVWFAGDAMCARLSALLDAVGGRPLLQEATAPVNAVGDDPGNEGAIFRRPLYNVPLPDGVLVFGDPTAYAIGDAGGIVAKVEPLYSVDGTKWYFRERTDGQVLISEALILANNLNG
jgi:HK97 family phage major capsid protein